MCNIKQKLCAKKTQHLKKYGFLPLGWLKKKKKKMKKKKYQQS